MAGGKACRRRRIGTAGAILACPIGPAHYNGFMVYTALNVDIYMYILRAALCCFYIVYIYIPLPVVVVSIAADVDFSSIIPHVTWLPTALYIAKSWRPPTIQLAERNSAVRPVDSATVQKRRGSVSM